MIPGAVFGYSLVGFWGIVAKGTSPADAIHRYLGFDRPELYVPLTILAYVAGHLLSFLSSITIERYALREFGYPSHYLLRLNSTGTGTPRRIIQLTRRLTDSFLLPVTLPEQILSKLGVRELYARPLDPFLASLIARKIEALLRASGGVEPSEDDRPAGRDFFRYVYHYAVENAPNHLPKMQNYVAIYGFLRTLSLIAVINFWLALGLRIAGKLTLGTAVVFCTAMVVTASVAFVAFSKFYRRFTLEALMAMSVVLKPGEPGA